MTPATVAGIASIRLYKTITHRNGSRTCGLYLFGLKILLYLNGKAELKYWKDSKELHFWKLRIFISSLPNNRLEIYCGECEGRPRMPAPWLVRK